MNGVIQRARRLCLTAITIGVALVATNIAMAQTEAPDPHADKSSWVLGYALVVLAIALGLTAVCRPGSRSKDVKIVDEE